MKAIEKSQAVVQTYAIDPATGEVFRPETDELMDQLRRSCIK